MPEVMDWRIVADPSAVVDRAVATLARGRLVAFPTETVYGIAASVWAPEGVERLAQSKGRPESKLMTLALKGASEALDWVPGLGQAGRRLARRCWPGPVTLVCDGGLEGGLADSLSDAVRRRICPGRALGLRVPDHDAVLMVLERLPGPIVLTSANRSGEPEATTAAAVVDAIGDHLDLVVDDGPSRYGQASTVVRVAGDEWEVLRDGAMPRTMLERLAACMVLFVCTGNTCRSPLAEALFKKRLADRSNCTQDELPRRGYLVLSAGLAAMLGCQAAPEAVVAAREFGADLEKHVSRPATPGLLEQADYVVAMTRAHKQLLADACPQLGTRLRLLSPEGRDVADPIGHEQAVYRECARDISNHLERLAAEVGAP